MSCRLLNSEAEGMLDRLLLSAEAGYFSDEHDLPQGYWKDLNIFELSQVVASPEIVERYPKSGLRRRMQAARRSPRSCGETGRGDGVDSLGE